METGHENLIFHISNVLANGVIFSTLEHTDTHTVRGRSTLKVGKILSVPRSIAKESNDLAKVLPESNQKSHDPQGSSSQRSNSVLLLIQ